jgi:hypothetical protein
LLIVVVGKRWRREPKSADESGFSELAIKLAYRKNLYLNCDNPIIQTAKARLSCFGRSIMGENELPQEWSEAWREQLSISTVTWASRLAVGGRVTPKMPI